MKIDERIKAIISAVVVIVINVAALAGFDLGDGATLQNALLAIAAMVSWAWAIWKNHNFTDAAAEGQKVVDAIKTIEAATGERVSAATAIELTGGEE